MNAIQTDHTIHIITQTVEMDPIYTIIALLVFTLALTSMLCITLILIVIMLVRLLDAAYLNGQTPDKKKKEEAEDTRDTNGGWGGPVVGGWGEPVREESVYEGEGWGEQIDADWDDARWERLAEEMKPRKYLRTINDEEDGAMIRLMKTMRQNRHAV